MRDNVSSNPVFPETEYSTGLRGGAGATTTAEKTCLCFRSSKYASIEGGGLIISNQSK